MKTSADSQLQSLNLQQRQQDGAELEREAGKGDVKRPTNARIPRPAHMAKIVWGPTNNKQPAFAARREQRKMYSENSHEFHVSKCVSAEREIIES